ARDRTYFQHALPLYPVSPRRSASILAAGPSLRSTLTRLHTRQGDVMVIVAGTIEVDPKDRDAFLSGRADAVRATRSEPGCIEYSFSADGLDPGLIRIFEVWESQEDLTTHLGAMAGQQGSGGPAVAVKKADVL